MMCEELRATPFVYSLRAARGTRKTEKETAKTCVTNTFLLDFPTRPTSVYNKIQHKLHYLSSHDKIEHK
jgi:hypothetical protein